MLFFKKYGGRMIVALVTIILIIMIGLTARDRENISLIENKIGNVLTPVQKFFYNTGESVSSTFKSIAGFTQLKDENQGLKEQVSKLESENRALEDIISRTDILRNQAILRKQSNHIFVSAQITGKDPGNWFDKFVIDKGLDDGIKKGDPVVQAVELEGDVVVEGLIGRVFEVGDNWAKVISIIDEGSSVSFRVIRTQDGGIASGSFEGDFEGYLFDAKSDVIVGDKLLTSGLGGIYVQNLYIGDIGEVTKKSDDLMKRIEIKPTVDFKNLFDVFVITGEKQ